MGLGFVNWPPILPEILCVKRDDLGWGAFSSFGPQKLKFSACPGVARALRSVYPVPLVGVWAGVGEVVVGGGGAFSSGVLAVLFQPFSSSLSSFVFRL